MMRDISLRKKLLFLLLCFVLVSVSLLFIRGYYETRKERIRGLTDELSKVEISVLNAIKAQNNFMIHEPINPAFFESGESVYVDLNDSISDFMSAKLVMLAENPLIIKLGMGRDFLRLKRALERYNKTFEEMVGYVWLRGYKNYGLEGEMREYAHILEDEYAQYVEPADILMLRRHEKDFIIRREEKYVLRFEYQAELIKYKLLLNDRLRPEKRTEIEQILDTYQSTFKEIVRTEKKIGLKESSGLKSQVDKNAQMFISSIEELKTKGMLAQEKLLLELRIYYIGGFVLFLLLSIWASIRISKNMTNRIQAVTNNLNKFVESNFKETTVYDEKLGTDEVGTLARNIKVLEDEIVIHFGMYRQKVERRTAEILSQKEELERKQNIIEQKNKDILDSIKYAKKIQDSILPEKRYLDQLLSDYFVFYKPKDIVSGDFYWVERTTERIYLAVADCTGHGVPGAFMSIMGNNFLNQAVNEKNLKDPDQILSYLNIAISSSLGQNQATESKNGGILTVKMKVQDGMDIALIALDYSKNEVLFAGAQRPLVIVRDGQLMEFKGDRFPVGGSSYGEIKRFSMETIQLKSGDNVYLFSDGFADQFGGGKNKKFKYAKLRELFISMRNDSPQTQKKILSEAHYLWRGDKEQVDDICILGLQI